MRIMSGRHLTAHSSGLFSWHTGWHKLAQIAQNTSWHNIALPEMYWPFGAVKLGYFVKGTCFLWAPREEGVVPEDGIFGLFRAIQREWLIPHNDKHLQYFQGIFGFSRSCGGFPLYAATYRVTYRDSEITGSSCCPLV